MRGWGTEFSECGDRRGYRGREATFFAAVLALTTAITFAPAFAAEPRTSSALDSSAVEIAQSGVRHSFDIAPQPLSDALNAFGKQADVQITADGDLIRNVSTDGVQGRMTTEQAIGRLLAGTGLTYSMSGNGSTVTVRKPGGQTGDDGVIELDPVQVEGQSETAYGPVDGYLATRSATGTKTDTPIIEIPASVQVVPRDVIEDQAAQNLKDVYENVSSVQQAGNTLNAQTEVLPIIRGFESPVLLRNGLRSTSVGTVDLGNVERVEVLKGPASILFGALEPGGIVNYVTEKPQTTAQYEIEQQVGQFDFYRTQADATGPITEDKTLAYRVNFAYTNSGSFRDDIDLERVAVAPSLLWMPADGTDLSFDLSYVQEKQPYDTGIPITDGGEPLVADSTFFGDPDLDGRKNEDFLAGYQLNHKFNDVWRVRNQFQYHRADNKNESLRPRGIAEVGGQQVMSLRYQHEDRTDKEVQFVADVTAKFGTGSVDHTMLFGSDIIVQDTDFRRFRQNVPTPVVISDNPTINFVPPANQPQQVRLAETQWASLYAQDQLSLIGDGRLKLLVGGRFDIVHQEQEVDGVSSPDIDDQALTGRGGLLYRITDQYSAYGSVSQSFIPQLAGIVDVNGAPLDPETGIQYEVGAKASFFDDSLFATLSIYQIEKSDVAVFDQALFNSTGQIAYFPGVKERSRGVELDVTGSITDEIQVLANYSYTKTKVLENPSDPTMVGDPLGGVAKHKARLWMTYNFAKASPLGGLGFGGGVRYVGKSTAQFDTDVKLDPYTVVDIGAWYTWKQVKLGLNVNNLLNKEYIVRASNDAIAHPGEPLTVIGSVAVKF